MSNDMTKYEYSKFMITQYVHESPTSYTWFGTKPPLDKVVCSRGWSVPSTVRVYSLAVIC